MFPEGLREEFYHNAYLCGGAIYSLRHDQTPKDYDFFLRSAAFGKKLAGFFGEFATAESQGRLYGTYGEKPLLITKYAISIGEFQIVMKFSGEPDDVVDQFDFKHNMFAYFDKEIFPYTEWEDLDSKQLLFNTRRSRDLCGTILRIPKFVARGMTISKKEMTNILKKLEENGFDEREQEIIEDYADY